MKEPSRIFQGKLINTDRAASKHALPGTRVNYFRAREQILSLKFNEDVRVVPFPPARCPPPGHSPPCLLFFFAAPPDAPRSVTRLLTPLHSLRFIHSLTRSPIQAGLFRRAGWPRSPAQHAKQISFGMRDTCVQVQKQRPAISSTGRRSPSSSAADRLRN